MYYIYIYIYVYIYIYMYYIYMYVRTRTVVRTISVSREKYDFAKSYSVSAVGAVGPAKSYFSRDK